MSEASSILTTPIGTINQKMDPDSATPRSEIISACADIMAGFEYEGDIDDPGYLEIRRKFNISMAFLVGNPSATHADLLAKATVFQVCKREDLGRSIADDVCALLK